MSAEKPSPISASVTASVAGPAAGETGVPNEGQSDRSSGGVAAGSGASAASSEALIALEFGLHKSLRYHAKRRAFFDGLHRVAMAVSAIAGSAAFFGVIGDRPRLGAAAALVVAISSTLDIVCGFSEKARQHDRLYERFSELAAELVCLDLDPINLRAADVNALRAKRLILEKGEPTVLDALNVICHNEEAQARGYDRSDIYRVGALQKLVAPLMTLPWFVPRAQE